MNVVLEGDRESPMPADFRNAAVLSPYERAWYDGAPGTRMASRRVTAYDWDYVMFYFPRIYEHVPVQALHRGSPADEWIGAAFLSMVLGQSRGSARVRPPRDLGKIPRVREEDIVDHDALALRYLSVCQSDLVYSGLLDGLVRDRNLSTSEKIHRLLCHAFLGNSENSKFITPELIEVKLAQAEANSLPLQFVVPAFPFKDQNPFRTGLVPAEHVDFGDVALLVRLHVLALAIWQVYPYGAEWLILSDGSAYAPIFGATAQQARQYQHVLRETRTRLNLEETVHLLDLLEATKRLKPSDGLRRRRDTNGEFALIQEEIEHRLRALVKDDSVIRERFDVLVRGMKWNIATRAYVDNYDIDDLWLALTAKKPRRNSPQGQEIFDEVRLKAQAAAFRYAAFSLATQHVRLYETLFPECLRSTVHAKQGQVAIPTLGSKALYPWNGCGVLRSGVVRPESVEAHEWRELVRGGHARARYRVGEDAPFVFEIPDGQ